MTMRVGVWQESIGLKEEAMNRGNGTICAFPI